MQVAFLQHGGRAGALFALNQVVNLVFLGDCLLNFCRGYTPADREVAPVVYALC